MLALSAAVACTEDLPPVTPSLEVDKTDISVAAVASEATFNVTSNQAWTATADAAWVTVNPASGDASDEAVGVTVEVEANTSEEARTANVTVKAGDLSATVKVSQAGVTGTDPEPEPEPEPEPDVDTNSWGMMGMFVDNSWASDIPMTKDGEWIVAKGAQFSELIFKIRANASWDDATNIGVAPGSERGVVNGKITVVTAEYSKANHGADAADIKLNGVAGTYDVYFSFENLEVYVMEQGYKPGEKEPQTPEPVEVTYTVVGTIQDHPWVNNYEGGLMVAEGNYLVAKNVQLVWNSTCYGGDYNVIEFKIVETGTWDGYAYPEKNVMQKANTEISLTAGGENIALEAPEGAYDVYFDKTNAKVWVMTPGYKPGETPAVDPWETAASFTNGADATDDLRFKELKAYADADYLYVRLTATKETPFGADYLDFHLTDGEGEKEVRWMWTTTGTDIYFQEHKCELGENGQLTKMRWYPVEGDRVYIDDYTTTSTDTEVCWEMKFPRSYVDVYKSSTGKTYLSFILWNGWADYWVIPARGNAMLEVTLP